MKVLEEIVIKVLPPEDGEVTMRMVRDDGIEADVPMSLADAELLHTAQAAGNRLRVVAMDAEANTVTIAVEGSAQ